MEKCHAAKKTTLYIDRACELTTFTFPRNMEFLGILDIYIPQEYGISWNPGLKIENCESCLSSIV